MQADQKCACLLHKQDNMEESLKDKKPIPFYNNRSSRKRCWSCKFSSIFSVSRKLDDGQIECRINPPSVGVFQWPIIGKLEWCGKHEEAEGLDGHYRRIEEL